MKRYLVILFLFMSLGCVTTSSTYDNGERKSYTVKYYNVAEGTPLTDCALVVATDQMYIYQINGKRFEDTATSVFKSLVGAGRVEAVALSPGNYMIGAYYNVQYHPSVSLPFAVESGHKYIINYYIVRNTLNCYVLDAATGEVVAGKKEK